MYTDNINIKLQQNNETSAYNIKSDVEGYMFTTRDSSVQQEGKCESYWTVPKLNDSPVH